MPFTKVGHNKYRGPSGKTFNLNQVKLYYAGGDHFPGQPGFKGRATATSAHKKRHTAR